MRTTVRARNLELTHSFAHRSIASCAGWTGSHIPMPRRQLALTAHASHANGRLACRGGDPSLERQSDAPVSSGSSPMAAIERSR